MSINSLDVRVNRDPRTERTNRAARSAAKFLRRQAELLTPDDKVELAAIVWELYWKMHKAGMLAAPVATRSLLREKYGFWTSAGVDRPVAKAA